MILPIYLAKKFIKAFAISVSASYSIFFIFSLIGNLGEKFSFNLIFYLSILNSFQIFSYIPSQLFILSLCLLIIQLKSKNELIIIKEYIDLKKLFLIIFPVMALFTFIEIKKDNFSKYIENQKLNLMNSKNLGDTKILITSDEDKKKYTIFNEYDVDKATISQYLSFETKNQKILKGEFSTDLNLQENTLYGFNTTIFENNDFINEDLSKELFQNFRNFWSLSKSTIIKTKSNNINSNYNIIHSIIFNGLFYLCMSIVFLSKRLVDRGMNTMKFFLMILSIFLYYLLIPNIKLNNYHHLFQLISIIIFILIFIRIKQYE